MQHLFAVPLAPIFFTKNTGTNAAKLYFRPRGTHCCALCAPQQHCAVLGDCIIAACMHDLLPVATEKFASLWFVVSTVRPRCALPATASFSMQVHCSTAKQAFPLSQTPSTCKTTLVDFGIRLRQCLAGFAAGLFARVRTPDDDKAHW